MGAYLVVRVDGVGVEVRRGGRRQRGRHDGVRHVRRHAAPVARLPPLARVVQHLTHATHSLIDTVSLSEDGGYDSERSSQRSAH